MKCAHIKQFDNNKFHQKLFLSIEVFSYFFRCCFVFAVFKWEDRPHYNLVSCFKYFIFVCFILLTMTDRCFKLFCLFNFYVYFSVCLFVFVFFPLKRMPVCMTQIVSYPIEYLLCLKLSLNDATLDKQQTNAILFAIKLSRQINCFFFFIAIMTVTFFYCCKTKSMQNENASTHTWAKNREIKCKNWEYLYSINCFQQIFFFFKYVCILLMSNLLLLLFLIVVLFSFLSSFFILCKCSLSICNCNCSSSVCICIYVHPFVYVCSLHPLQLKFQSLCPIANDSLKMPWKITINRHQNQVSSKIYFYLNNLILASKNRAIWFRLSFGSS